MIGYESEDWFLVSWKSPVTGSVEADTMEMGVDGLEGRYVHRITYVQWASALNFCHSKPGAAPLAVWLGHEVIGLHKGGYGFLLGQSVFSSTKVSHVTLCPPYLRG
jgi:hypothetical protein